MMTELDFEHVIGYSLRSLRRRIRKNEFGGGIDELRIARPNLRDQFLAVDGLSKVASISLYSKLIFRLRALYGKSKRFCLLKESVQILAARALEVVKITDFLEALAKFLQLVSKECRGVFAGLGILDKEIQRLKQFIVIA